MVIKVSSLGKSYHIYESPASRLLQMAFHGRKKFYKEFWALRNLSFRIEKGETVGIVGRNGSGKSTLLQLICGVLQPTTGTVDVSGKVAALLELGSGFNPEFSGRENVFLNGALLGMSRKQIESRFSDIERFADIGEFIDQPVKKYSSGMGVRLAFSVAIHSQPEILIVDEALAVGDELFQRKCFSRIEEIKRSGATILFVSHSGATIIELCDRALLVDAGELLASGKPKEILGQYQRLLYAPKDKQPAIRGQIRESFLATYAAPAVVKGKSVAEPATSVEVVASRYDPSFKSKSAVSYGGVAAQILDVHIVDDSGNKVNCLVRNEVYRYRYRVRFTESARWVRFGMMIKTVKGQELGGAVSARRMEERVEVISAASEVDVEFSFRCSLNPSTYFMNAGVLGFDGGEERYLHRVLDALVFKVLPDDIGTPTGFIDFDCKPRLENVSCVRS